MIMITKKRKRRIKRRIRKLWMMTMLLEMIKSTPRKLKKIRMMIKLPKKMIFRDNWMRTSKM